MPTLFDDQVAGSYSRQTMIEVHNFLFQEKVIPCKWRFAEG
jgi:hypothetical protein